MSRYDFLRAPAMSRRLLRRFFGNERLRQLRPFHALTCLSRWARLDMERQQWLLAGRLRGLRRDRRAHPPGFAECEGRCLKNLCPRCSTPVDECFWEAFSPCTACEWNWCKGEDDCPPEADAVTCCGECLEAA